jgi:hypothetical protein
VEHQTGFFLQGHPGQQVADPFLDGPPPVLVGIEPAIFVQVSELKVIYLQDAGMPGDDRGLREIIVRHKKPPCETDQFDDPFGSTVSVRTPAQRMSRDDAMKAWCPTR